MKLAEFDYSLPKELIAQHPAAQRDKCRLMVLERASKRICHRTFEDIIDYFRAGDLLVLNDTKVIPARLLGRRKSGGRVELFLLEKTNPVCEALVRPSARLKEGERVILESGDEVEILNRGGVGRFVRFNRPVDMILGEAGRVPLPPYITRLDEESDRRDYQTVYAANEGATASPTAGLHFTQKLLDRIESKGMGIKHVTLHTNYGTFAPVKTEDVESHHMHKEDFSLPEETAEAVMAAKNKGGRVFAVGTTTTRVLEHCADTIGSQAIKQDESRTGGQTGLFIYPGFKFRIVDSLITNFHLPRSTLLLLACAFAGKEFALEAYKQAVAGRYRFFSYGDAMLIV